VVHFFILEIEVHLFGIHSSAQKNQVHFGVWGAPARSLFVVHLLESMRSLDAGAQHPS
jgi:hypothetical protein